LASSQRKGITLLGAVCLGCVYFMANCPFEHNTDYSFVPVPFFGVQYSVSGF